MLTSDLVRYLDEYLGIDGIPDYGPQGLQVEGRRLVNRIVGLVDAQMPCVEAALQTGADMMLVHHGIFWGPTQPLRGQLGRLVRTILASELNLYAAHLALDGHQEVGNNAGALPPAGLGTGGVVGGGERRAVGCAGRGCGRDEAGLRGGSL